MVRLSLPPSHTRTTHDLLVSTYANVLCCVCTCGCTERQYASLEKRMVARETVLKDKAAVLAKCEETIQRLGRPQTALMLSHICKIYCINSLCNSDSICIVSCFRADC